MRNFYSPLRYPGGKNRIFEFVAELITTNGLTGNHYVEPYAGGAGIALRLLYEEYASTITINDIDPLVHAFWSVCVNQNDRLLNWIHEVDVSLLAWQEYKKISAEPAAYDTFTLATAFLFLNRTNVSGIISGGVIGGIRQNGKYKIHARFTRDTLAKRISKIGRFASRISVTNLDGLDLLQYHNSNRDGIFMYLDPPYFKKGADLYLNAYGPEDHIRLAEALSEVQFPWILSYDQADFIINLYPEFKKANYSLRHATSNSSGDEIMIFSPSIKFERSLRLLNGKQLL